MPANIQSLEDYVRNGSAQIEGWLARTDAEIMKSILLYQGIEGLQGSVAEIGVHHGRAFIELCLGMQDNEKAYCIDIFGMQQLNADYSGRGDRPIFENNLRKYGIESSKVHLDQRSSVDVVASDILGISGRINLFSVDGGHWREIVASDLRLAEGVLSEHGVIALDDFYRPEWPDVSLAFFEWFASRTGRLVPFAIGFNKLYICDQAWVESYKQVLRDNKILSIFHSKDYLFLDNEIPIYQRYSLPENDLRSRVRDYIRMYNPDALIRLKKLFRKRF